MPLARWSRRLSESTQGRIIGLLRRASMTVDELATALGLTDNAIRTHLATLERDGLVHQDGTRRGASKPAYTYGLTPGTELLFSRAYVPLLTQLLHVLAERMRPEEFDAVMRHVGRRLMHGRPMPRGDTRQRTQAASALLNELGGLTEVEEQDGGFVIRGYGCPLSAATHEHPEACNAVESLLSEFIGAPVKKCCDREERLRCCFEVFPSDTSTSAGRSDHVSPEVSR